MPEDVPPIGAFLDKFWQTENGKVYFACSKNHAGFRQYFVDWPLERQKVVNAIPLLVSQGYDVWFCPSVYNADALKPERAYVQSVNAHWVDLDGNAPENWEAKAKEVGVPEPSLILETSVPGHQHAYWFIDRVGADGLDQAETTTRNLTAAFQSDKGGWDLTQLLRIPGTKNYGWHTADGEHKPWYKGEPQTVKVLKDEPVVVSPTEFTGLTKAEQVIVSRIKIEHVPPIAEVLALGKWDQEMFNWFNMTKQQASEATQYRRSGSLQALAHFATKAGFTDEQIYSILDDADRRWEKYIQRHKSGRHKVFLDTIARARDEHGYLTGDAITLAGLMESANLIHDPKVIFNFEEFLEADFKVEWLLDGLIPLAGFGMIVGQPGIGKTRLGLQMGMELAIGRSQIFHRYNTTGPKRVLFMSLEMAANPLSEFVGKFAPAYKESMPALKRNFYIAPFGEPVYLDTPQGQQLLTNIVAQYKPDVLLIDSLQTSVSKAMTDELAMKALSTFILKLKNDTNMAVIFVHHERKKSSDRTGIISQPDLSDIYGSQMIAANIDFAISLSQVGTYIKLDEVKNRFAQSERDITLHSEGIRFVTTDPSVEVLLGSQGNGDSNESPEQGTGPKLDF